VFPSIQLEFLAEVVSPEQPCFDKDPQPCIVNNLGLIKNLKRDIFAISTYSYQLGPSRFSNDWFSRVFQHLPNESFAIAETGQNTDPIVLTGSEYPEMLIFVALIAFAFVFTLPLGIWMCCCFIKGKKLYARVVNEEDEQIYQHTNNIFKKWAYCCCFPSHFAYNSSRKTCMTISFVVTALLWGIGFGFLYAPWCNSQLPNTEDTAATYLKFVVEQAHTYDMVLVTWWSNRDLIPKSFMIDCPCKEEGESKVFCEYINQFKRFPYGYFLNQVAFKIFGTMGVRQYDGTPKPEMMHILQTARTNCSIVT